MIFFYQRNHTVNAISSGVEGLQEVVGPPLDNVTDMAKLPNSLVFSTVLDDAPAEEGHGECSWEVELDSVTSVIVPAD